MVIKSILFPDAGFTSELAAAYINVVDKAAMPYGFRPVAVSVTSRRTNRQAKLCDSRTGNNSDKTPVHPVKLARQLQVLADVDRLPRLRIDDRVSIGCLSGGVDPLDYRGPAVARRERDRKV